MLNIDLKISTSLGNWSEEYYKTYTVTVKEDYLEDMCDEEKYDFILESLEKCIQWTIKNRY